MEIIFWLTLAVVIYTYIGYPVLIMLLSVLFPNRVDRKEIEPTVTFMITIYNEEKAIEDKIKNTLSLNYPREKLQIIVASDGSTDRSEEIVKKFSKDGVILHRVEGRVGKTETQNQTMKLAKGEITIFSDGTTDCDRQVIRKIVRNYNDPAVGAVSGRYEYRNPTGGSVGLGQILFWKYENTNKVCQTNLKTLTGCYGPLYSVRTELYEPLPRDIISDFIEPLKIVEKGYRIVFEKEALAHELTTENAAQEFKMRVRVISRGMNGLLYVRNLFNPFRFGIVSFQLFSHKVLRWLVPVFMIILLVSNLFLLDRAFYLYTFIAQAAFYGLAAIGWVADRLKLRLKVFSMPLFFCIVNMASIVALVKTITGKKAVTWDPIRN